MQNKNNTDNRNTASSLKHIIFPVTNEYQLRNLIKLSGYEREIRYICANHWQRTLNLQSQYTYILYVEREHRNVDKANDILFDSLKTHEDSRSSLEVYYNSIYTPAAYISACYKLDEPYKNCIIINSFATHPSYRRCGYAKILLKLLINQSCKPIITIVPDEYIEVCELLTKLRFTVAMNINFNSYTKNDLSFDYLKSGYLFIRT